MYRVQRHESALTPLLNHSAKAVTRPLLKQILNFQDVEVFVADASANLGLSVYYATPSATVHSVAHLRDEKPTTHTNHPSSSATAGSFVAQAGLIVEMAINNEVKPFAGGSLFQ